MRYYIDDQTQPQGFREITETEYLVLFGDDTVRPFASAVYRGELCLEDVPAELRASVQEAVVNRVNLWGLHKEETDTPIEA